MTREDEAHVRFEERYRSGTTPWDTGISPPELLQAVSGPAALHPGRFLDLGCGTGTNCVELACRGWQAVGVDFAALALQKAEQKAQERGEEIARAGGSTRFVLADVTRLPPPPAREHFTLVLDLGCLNGIPPHLREDYAQVVARQTGPEALFLLYAHLPDSQREVPLGCTPEEINHLFSPAFHLERRVFGSAPQGGQSMWNWLQRMG